MDIVRCFIAFFVPPLAVYLQEGLSRRHWIAVLLTMLGIIPGILFAIYAVFEYESRPLSLPAIDRNSRRPRRRAVS